MGVWGGVWVVRWLCGGLGVCGGGVVLVCGGVCGGVCVCVCVCVCKKPPLNPSPQSFSTAEILKISAQ